MVYGAIDLHMRHSQIRVIDADGKVLRDKRIATDRDELVKAFERWGTLRIVVETGTESEWVAQTLEAAGHEVVVVDPNYAPMYGETTRRVKTDRRDVAALAEANRRGWYRATHRVSAEQRAMRQRLRVRRQLVQMRTAAVSVVRALLKQDGYRLRSCGAERVPAHLETLAVPTALATALAPLARLIATTTTEITALDRELRAQAATDPIVQRLLTVPGVGVVVALTFRTQLDTVDRFTHAGQVSALLGLVPREDSSAERRHRGHITKAGPRELRSLLVQAAWACWRSKQSATLKTWAEQLAARRGRRIAVVALARRLSRILYAIWRDGSTFEVKKLAAAA
jgi:transposase